MNNIVLKKSRETRINRVNWDNLGFGNYFSDHMFVADFVDGDWSDPRIEAYGPMMMEPALCTLHYGQTIFEGLKAFRSINGGVNIFRPYMNAHRLNYSAERLCIPAFDEDLFVSGIRELIKIDYEWIPRERGHSLYIRPVVFGTDAFLGVRASQTYRIIIMTSPVASYYAEGLNPVRIKIESDLVRAIRGGLGSAKTAANYAASLYSASKAKKQGFAQVLFLDGVTLDFVDEVGTMNIMFLIDDELITPPLDQGSILAGITRDTALTLARSWGLRVSERRLSMTEVYEAHNKGKLQEAFGTGTAAIISPVGELNYKDTPMIINGGRIGTLAQRLYDTITGIQYGEIEDAYEWNVTIPQSEFIAEPRVPA